MRTVSVPTIPGSLIVDVNADSEYGSVLITVVVECGGGPLGLSTTTVSVPPVRGSLKVEVNADAENGSVETIVVVTCAGGPLGLPMNTESVPTGSDANMVDV
jgi:hypothetical protein